MRSRRSKRVWRRKERWDRRPAPARDRGTVLLMVIGVLALLAIIAVVYAALGQADRRTSSAYVRSVQIDDISDQLGAYIAGIIGADVHAYVEEEYPSKSGGQAQVRQFRPAWTYPGMEINDEVQSDPPANTGVRFSPVGGATDPKHRGYQPWLAPIEPTWLRFNDATNWTDPDLQYLDHRDWLSISNVAPNGQFVNLRNLRNNFSAESGVGLDARGMPRMSENLTLFGDSGLPYRASSARLEDGRSPDPNVPWHWTMRQLHAARPAATFTFGGGLAEPGEDEWLLNQWCDADGDGIVDSRWMEWKVPAGSMGQWEAPGLSQQDRARYFAAVRVVDLSGMINVNTAMDILQAPGPIHTDPAQEPGPTRYPYGISGADVDLLRALTLKDAYERYGVGYDAIQQPAGLQSAGNYRQYLNQTGNTAAQKVGRSAFTALQRATSLDRGGTGTVQGLNPNLVYTDPAITPLDERVQAFTRRQVDAGNVGYSTFNINANYSWIGTGTPFGMTEQLELHAFFGVNDPRERSRLEAVVEGRRTKAPDILPSFGPLRSSRGLDIERERRGDLRADGQQDDDSLAAQHVDLRHRLTTISEQRPLTTLSRPGSFDPKAIGDSEVRVDLRPYMSPTAERTARELNRLFNHVCDALMPYRNTETSENVWDITNAARENRALHYGNNAEFAVRCAAHWVANFIDSIDDDNSTDESVRGPTVFTLRTVKGASTNQTPDFPWEQVTLSRGPDLPASEEFIDLAEVRSDVESQLVNIYGIEAQPFLCEVGSYAFWTDMPWNVTSRLLPGQQSPDDEFQVPPIPPIPVTIDDRVDYTNADFLGEIVAFQVTNPFDRDIYLTRAGQNGPEFIFYVEYANRFFPLAAIDEASEPAQFLNMDLKLEAGETRVFYATSPRREFNFNERFRVANGSTTVPSGVPDVPTGPASFLGQWVNTQFKKTPAAPGQGDPVHTMIFDPERFEPVDSNAPGGTGEQKLADLHGEHDSPAATDDERKEVRLWRVMRAEWRDPEGGLNDRRNDLMADRLRDPAVGGPTLFQRLDAGNDITGTEAGDDHQHIDIGGGSPLDNTGFSVTMWGAIRRPTNPTDPRDTNAEALQGAMPPWCIEVRQDTVLGWDAAGNPLPVGQLGGRRNLNREFDGPAGRGDQDEYGGSDSRYRRLRSLVTDQTQGDGGTRLNDQMRETPDDKKQNPIPFSHSLDEDGNPVAFNEQAVRIALSGKNTGGTVMNPGMYKRIGDVLLPLAVGPYYDPHHQDPTGAKQRMTLSEALALACDYFSPPEDPRFDRASLYYLAGHRDDSANPPIVPKLDQGHFVIDGFVPFHDADANGAFNPGAGNRDERPLGLGIPLALNLLDKFRLEDFGGKAKGESGRVSINTAPLLNLSCLPMLAPDPHLEWLTLDLDPVREGVYDPTAITFDGAATLMAYRDKLDARTRPLFNVIGIGEDRVANRINNSTMEISFRDTNNPLINPWDRDGRRVRTHIPGLREDLGFRSVGEVLGAVLREVPPAAAGQEEAYFSNSLDWLGRDERLLKGQRGLEPVNVRTDTAVVSDEVVDDYGEKLAIASALLNTITVRSDTFCVWFVLHGYLPSDVENLGHSDPMVPSVARRYMMIVDRTNVVKEGDKPRILLFREVPL